MRLSESDAWARLVAADHGVLGTVHPDRAVDLVPVVFVAGDDRELFVPIDTVKPKSTTRLQRLTNVGFDDRCTLLAESYADDWSRLWWVRAHGRGEVIDEDSGLAPYRDRLAAKHPQYRSPESVSGGIRIRVSEIRGWSAS